MDYAQYDRDAKRRKKDEGTIYCTGCAKMSGAVQTHETSTNNGRCRNCDQPLKWKCSCGMVMVVSSRSRHLRSSKHQQLNMSQTRMQGYYYCSLCGKPSEVWRARCPNCSAEKMLWKCILCDSAVSATNRSSHVQSQYHHKNLEQWKLERGFPFVNEMEMINSDEELVPLQIPLLQIMPQRPLGLNPPFGTMNGGTPVALDFDIEAEIITVEWGSRELDPKAVQRMATGLWIVITPSNAEATTVAVRVLTKQGDTDVGFFCYIRHVAYDKLVSIALDPEFGQHAMIKETQ